MTINQRICSVSTIGKPVHCSGAADSKQIASGKKLVAGVLSSQSRVSSSDTRLSCRGHLAPICGQSDVGLLALLATGYWVFAARFWLVASGFWLEKVCGGTGV